MARLMRGMTQRDLADAVGVTRETINRIENCRATPSFTTALALAKSLNRTPHDLLAD